jgi:hypothetical protein
VFISERKYKEQAVSEMKDLAYLFLQLDKSTNVASCEQITLVRSLHGRQLGSESVTAVSLKENVFKPFQNFFPDKRLQQIELSRMLTIGAPSGKGIPV